MTQLINILKHPEQANVLRHLKVWSLKYEIKTVPNEDKKVIEAFRFNIYFLDSEYSKKKSRIWETQTLSTDADSRTDTISEKLRIFFFF